MIAGCSIAETGALTDILSNGGPIPTMVEDGCNPPVEDNACAREIVKPVFRKK